MSARGVMREGLAERLIDDVYGEGAANEVRLASVGHYGMVAVPDTTVRARDGELFPIIAGGALDTYDKVIAGVSNPAKSQTLPFRKVGTAGVVDRGLSYWAVGSRPPAGQQPTGLAGDPLGRTSTGALGQVDAGGTDKLYLPAVPAYVPSTASHVLILYDRIMQWRPAVNTTSAQTFTGTPARWQGAPGTADSSVGNMAFLEVQTALPATAHNWTITYTDQDGNAGASSGSFAGVSSAAIHTSDHSGLWIPTATGDIGIRDLETITLSATLASGAVNAVLAHPLCYIPSGSANVPVALDLVNNVIAMPEIPDDACLSFYDNPGNTTATTFEGTLLLAAG